MPTGNTNPPGIRSLRSSRHSPESSPRGAGAAHMDLEGAARRAELHRVGHQVLQDALQLAALDRDASAGVEIGLGAAAPLADLLAELALDFGIDVGQIRRMLVARCAGAL